MFKKKDEAFIVGKPISKPRLTYLLISVCIAVYLLELSFSSIYGSGFIEKIFNQYGFSLQSLLQGRWWIFLTSLFLHASPEHLILNMLAFYFFGKVVERELGAKKFLLVFFSAAFFGDLAIILMTFLGQSAAVPTVGASAAIFGLMGVAMLVKPFEMIFYPYLIPVPLMLVAILYTLYNISAFIVVLLAGKETDIAYAAHLGGLLAGMFFGFREEGGKRSFMIICIFFMIMLFVPFLWTILNYLQIFNYITGISKIFG